MGSIIHHAESNVKIFLCLRFRGLVFHLIFNARRVETSFEVHLSALGGLFFKTSRPPVVSLFMRLETVSGTVTERVSGTLAISMFPVILYFLIFRIKDNIVYNLYSARAWYGYPCLSRRTEDSFSRSHFPKRNLDAHTSRRYIQAISAERAQRKGNRNETHSCPGQDCELGE